MSDLNSNDYKSGPRQPYEFRLRLENENGAAIAGREIYRAKTVEASAKTEPRRISCAT
jgi:hypothetical protein